MQRLAEQIRFAGNFPENPSQLLRLLKRHDPHVYRRTMVTCVFDPAKALCLRSKKDTPNLEGCQPLACTNAIFSPEDVTAWRAHGKDMLHLAREGSLAPFVRFRAEDSGTKLSAFFDAVDRRAATDGR